MYSIGVWDSNEAKTYVFYPGTSREVSENLFLNVYYRFSGVFEPPVDGVYFLSVYAITTENEGPIFIKSNENILCQEHPLQSEFYVQSTAIIFPQQTIIL